MITRLLLNPLRDQPFNHSGIKQCRCIAEILEVVCRDLFQNTAHDLSAVILLKSHVDIVSDGLRTKYNFTGNPGMTVGGTGDVLSGIVAAFLAQSADPFEAAVAGAYVNGAAGDFAKAEKGYHMVATDLLDWIPKILDDPMCHLKIKEESILQRY